MFCPRCGVNNVDDAKYCRACGEEIALVAVALEHRLRRGPFGVEVVEREKPVKKERRERPKEPPKLEKGVQNIFMGFAWLIIFYVAFFYYGGSFYFWGWLLIPMLASFGEGLGLIIRSQRESRALAHAADEPEPLPEQPRPEELPAPDTSEIIPARPQSVTEETTRKLGVHASRLREER